MQNNEQKALFRSSMKIFGLTLFLLVSLLGEILLVLPVLAPNAAISLFDTLGMKKAVVATYEIKYNKSQKTEDLYNLIVSASACGDTNKVLKFSSEILQKKDFAAFAQAFDEYALENSDKDKLYLVASVKNYILGLQVEAKYKQDKEAALLLAASCFEENNLSSIYFEQYVNAVSKDKKLTDAQKTELLVAAADFKVGNKAVVDILQDRYLQNVPESLSDANLLLLEQLWQTKNIQLALLNASGTDTADVKVELKTLATAINAKIS